jgi:hypothetical protein
VISLVYCKVSGGRRPVAAEYIVAQTSLSCDRLSTAGAATTMVKHKQYMLSNLRTITDQTSPMYSSSRSETSSS